MSDQTPPGDGDTPSDERPPTPPPSAPPPPAASPPPSYPGSAPPPPGGTGAPPPQAPPPAPPSGSPPSYPSAPPYGSSPGSAPPYGSSPGSAPPYGSSPPPASPYGGSPGGYPYGVGPTDRFGRPLAGWWQRFGAILIDGLILSIPQDIIARAAVGTSTYASRFHPGLIVIGIVFVVIDIAYFALLNGSQKGQTVGQMALGITVRDAETGGPIEPARAAYRILVLIPGLLLDWIPFIALIAFIYTIVAGLSPLWDAQRRGFHDKAARTDVIKTR